MCSTMCEWRRTWHSTTSSSTKPCESAVRRRRKTTVTEALQEYIGRRKQARIADLFGTIDYDPKYDYKKQRRRP